MVKLNYIEIGNRIRTRRKQLNMTQKDLAHKVNLSEGSISRYENGKVEEAATSKLNEFATILGVEPIWLIGFKIEDDIEHKTKEILSKAKGIPDEVMNQFLNMLDSHIKMYKDVNKID